MSLFIFWLSPVGGAAGALPRRRNSFMSVKDKLKKFDIDPEELQRQVDEALGADGTAQLEKAAESSVGRFEPHTILRGKVVRVLENDVVVDVGYKSEGLIPIQEFENPEALKPGDEFDVLLLSIEDSEGFIVLSKREADRARVEEYVFSHYKEGDDVKGIVARKIKGGLLVRIPVPEELGSVPFHAFLPASQVNIRRSGDVAEWIGKEIEARIIKLDPERRNMVVSRRKLLEEERAAKKEKLLAELEEGQIRKGVVKNIADFGVFVDLGGLDGLLHITDMSWGRINHPSEMVKIDDEIEVKVLRVDKERERVALGLKQKAESPWERIEEKYPVGSKVRGTVVNIMNYGAFVKLEDGVEGLVHVSEMSWTRRVNHPSEVVQVGDEVEVMVLDINKEKQEISLGMKQTEVNPWDLVEEKYPVGTVLRGRVRNLTSYGCFVELEEGIDGLLHISDMSWTKKVTHPSEVVKKGDLVECVVLAVDKEKRRISLGLKQLQPDPWQDEIPAKYHIGDTLPGKVTKITNFGVFVELEEDLEGLLHVSELSDHKVEDPEEVVKVGQKIEVRIIKIDPDERKIGLTLISTDFETGAEEEEKKEGKAEEKKALPERRPMETLLGSQLKAHAERLKEVEQQGGSAEEEPSGEAQAEAPSQAGGETAAPAGEEASGGAAPEKAEDSAPQASSGEEIPSGETPPSGGEEQEPEKKEGE